MNKIFLFLAVIFLSGKTFSQTPVTGREVSGIVKDSTDNGVIGAVVVLTTATDSVKLNTNNNGFFIFKNIKTGQFTISVRSIGYRSFNKRFLYNDGTSKLVLDPIILKESSSLLNTVTINGTPSIIYKEDTVEYRASDYVVKANASVEDLIKKMEGVEVGNDGSVTHQGIAVARAKINGKNVGGADLANTIQNLPAEIVEKIQMVDDYGDQAARTGIKDGDPERILNIVTRADRSVGNRLQADAGAGNNDRYNARLNLTRFNGNQQIFARNNFNNTVTGVAGGNQSDGGGRGGGSGGVNSGGLNTSGGATISYSDKWSKELEFDGSYSFNSRNSTATNNSETHQSNQKFGPVLIINDGDSENKRSSHDLDARLRYEIDSSNFLQISPSVEFTSTGNSNFANINQSGGINQDRISRSGSESSTPDYGLTTLYSHNFSKKGRVFSTQLTFKLNNNDQDRTSENNYRFYDLTNGTFKDSIANLSINNGNKSTNYRASVTFSEPLTSTSRLEFNGQINRREYDNSQITDSIDVNGIYHREYSLSKIYNYAFTEQRYALNYRYLKGSYNVSLGVTAVPALLSGFSETLNTSTDRHSFNVIPIARFEYQWSRQKRFKLNYTGSPQEPSFNQIQDVPDLSNPQNPIYGNPFLKAQFRHSINSSFNNYVVNSRLNFSANVQATMTDNKVIRNTIELDKSRGSRATYFTNANGDYSANANYNISKQFANRKYRVGLNGTVNFANSVSMLNGNTNVAQIWTLNQRLGIQLYPTEWFEFTPNVRYNYLKSEFSLNDRTSKTTTWAFSAEGRVDFIDGFFMEYDLSKNYVSGIDANVSSNPFIINASLSKDILKKKGTIRLRAFDMLNQNNFVVRDINTNDLSYTDTKSNALSRYFMLSFTVRLQKWTGTPNRGGRPMHRRGDGSFIE